MRTEKLVKYSGREGIAMLIVREYRNGLTACVRRMIPFDRDGGVETDVLDANLAIADVQLENAFASGAVI